MEIIAPERNSLKIPSIREEIEWRRKLVFPIIGKAVAANPELVPALKAKFNTTTEQEERIVEAAGNIKLWNAPVRRFWEIPGRFGYVRPILNMSFSPAELDFESNVAELMQEMGKEQKERKLILAPAGIMTYGFIAAFDAGRPSLQGTIWQVNYVAVRSRQRENGIGNFYLSVNLEGETSIRWDAVSLGIIKAFGYKVEVGKRAAHRLAARRMLNPYRGGLAGVE